MSQALRDAAQAMLDAIDGTPAINTAGQWWKIHAQYANLKQSILGLEGEQVHTMSMYASRDDLERARFEGVCLNCFSGDVTVLHKHRDMYSRGDIEFAWAIWMAALRGQK